MSDWRNRATELLQIGKLCVCVYAGHKRRCSGDDARRPERLFRLLARPEPSEY